VDGAHKVQTLSAYAALQGT